MFRPLMLLALGALLGTGPAIAQERIALLIGNQAYPAEVGALRNPHNDIELVAAALREDNFEVLPLVKDARRVTMLGAVRQFVTRLNAAGAGATGFFYYAGHGAADATRVNYLIPVDATQPQTTEFWDQSIKLDDILSLLESAQQAARFVVFDACRNELSLPERSLTKGFTRVGEQAGTYIAFSTAPGRPASDGRDMNGPYAKALAAELVRPGQHHLDLFQNVKEAVAASSGGGQIPWESSGLQRRVFFAPAFMPLPFSDKAMPSFDCDNYIRGAPLQFSKGRTPIGDLLCHDPQLAAVDKRMADAYDKLKGTSKNSSRSSSATKSPAIDSALFPFRFIDVHPRAACDWEQAQFFEVPSRLFCHWKTKSASKRSSIKTGGGGGTSDVT